MELINVKHPDTGETAQVGPATYEKFWKRKGWIIDQKPKSSRKKKAESSASTAESATVEASGTDDGPDADQPPADKEEES